MYRVQFYCIIYIKATKIGKKFSYNNFITTLQEN